MKTTYQIIRSDRKTLALQIKDGALIVRAPRRAKQAEIERRYEKWGALVE